MKDIVPIYDFGSYTDDDDDREWRHPGDPILDKYIQIQQDGMSNVGYVVNASTGGTDTERALDLQYSPFVHVPWCSAVCSSQDRYLDDSTISKELLNDVLGHLDTGQTIACGQR